MLRRIVLAGTLGIAGLAFSHAVAPQDASAAGQIGALATHHTAAISTASTTYSGFGCGVFSPYTHTGYYTYNSSETDSGRLSVLRCSYQSSETPPRAMRETGFSCGTYAGGSSFYSVVTETRTGLISMTCYALNVYDK